MLHVDMVEVVEYIYGTHPGDNAQAPYQALTEFQLGFHNIVVAILAEEVSASHTLIARAGQTYPRYHVIAIVETSVCLESKRTLLPQRGIELVFNVGCQETVFVQARSKAQLLQIEVMAIIGIGGKIARVIG